MIPACWKQRHIRTWVCILGTHWTRSASWLGQPHCGGLLLMAYGHWVNFPSLLLHQRCLPQIHRYQVSIDWDVFQRRMPRKARSNTPRSPHWFWNRGFFTTWVIGNYELTRHTWKLFFFKPLLGEVRNIGLVTAPCWEFRRVVTQRVLIVFVLHFMKQVDVCGFWRSCVTAFCGPIPHRKKKGICCTDQMILSWKAQFQWSGHGKPM